MKYYQKNMFFNYVYEFLLNLDFSRIIWPTYLILKGYNLIDVGDMRKHFSCYIFYM